MKVNFGIISGLEVFQNAAEFLQSFRAESDTSHELIAQIEYRKAFKHPSISEPTMAMRMQLVRLAKARVAHFSSSSKTLGEVPLKNGVRGALASISPLDADTAASPAFLTQPKVRN
jgi:hypothetical protein